MKWTLKQIIAFGNITEDLPRKISESCLNDILDLVEGNIIDFQEKRKDKVLDKNAHEVASLFRNKNVRITNTGGLIGDPQAIKRIGQIEQSNNEVLGNWLKYKKKIEKANAQCN